MSRGLLVWVVMRWYMSDLAFQDLLQGCGINADVIELIYNVIN